MKWGHSTVFRSKRLKFVVFWTHDIQGLINTSVLNNEHSKKETCLLLKKELFLKRRAGDIFFCLL